MNRMRISVLLCLLILLYFPLSVRATDVNSYSIEKINSFGSENTAETEEAIMDSTPKENDFQSITLDYILQNITFPLVIEFIGAFLGVLSALALDSHANKKQYADVNNSLFDELKGIGNELHKIIGTDYLFYYYLTPAWDINMAAGNLSLLTEPKLRKKGINSKYITIYAQIQYAQKLEHEYLQCRLLELKGDVESGLTEYTKVIDKARKNEAHKIYEMINNLTKDVT